MTFRRCRRSKFEANLAGKASNALWFAAKSRHEVMRSGSSQRCKTALGRVAAAGATPVGSRPWNWSGSSRGSRLWRRYSRARSAAGDGAGRALNFNKGCYVGQEIVERIRSRGAVHRKFTGFSGWMRPVSPGSKDNASMAKISEKSPASLRCPELSTGRSLWDISGARLAAPGREVMIGRRRRRWRNLPLRTEMLHAAESSLEQRPA